VLPRNKETSCAKHIEANICQKFGQECARYYVMPIANTFSFRYSNHLIDQVRMNKPHAADYIQNVNNDTLWRSTLWLNEENPLPPHNGIVISNTSECVKNMFAEAQTVEWLEAVESIVDVLSRRISTWRAKHIDQEPGKMCLVWHRLKRRWDAAASVTVVELVRVCGDFKVVKPSRIHDSDNNPHLPNMPLKCRATKHYLPCWTRVAVVYLGHLASCVLRVSAWLCCLLEVEGKGFQLCPPEFDASLLQIWVRTTDVHNNIFPACIDHVNYNDTTRPNVVQSHSRGAQEANDVDKVSFVIQTNHLFHVQIVANEDTIKEHAKANKLGRS
jgi:hypothetical protein